MSNFFLKNPGLDKEVKEAVKPSAKDSSEIPEKKVELGPWTKMAGTILKESKKSTNPSTDYLNQRINIFRAKMKKPSVFNALKEEAKATNNFTIKRAKQVTEEEKIKRQIHEMAQEKMRKDAGHVQFHSFKKKMQFQFRVKKAEKKLEEKGKSNQSPEQDKKEAKAKENAVVFERLFKNTNRSSTMVNKVERDEPLDREFKTAIGEELYRALKGCNDDESIKKTALSYLSNYYQKIEENFDLKNSIFNKIPKFYSDDCKEFNLYMPDVNLINKYNAKEIDSILEGNHTENFDEESLFLIKNLQKIMKGNVINYWKYMQDVQEI